MTTSKLTPSSVAPPAEPPSPVEKLEEDAELAGAAVAGGLRAVEVGVIVLIGLLVVPPLGILVFLVVAPLLVIALVLGLLFAVVTTPYLIYHHFRGHHGHGALLAQRLRHAGRALVDLLPHRIVADARKLHAGR